MAALDIVVLVGAVICGLAVALALRELRSRLGSVIEIEIQPGRSTVRLVGSKTQFQLENIMLCSGEGTRTQVTQVGAWLAEATSDRQEEVREINLESIEDENLSTAAWEAFVLHCVTRARASKTSRQWTLDTVRLVVRDATQHAAIQTMIRARNRNLLPTVEVVH